MFCRLKQIGEMNHFCLKQVQCLKAFSNTPPTQTSYKGAIYVTLFPFFLTHSPLNRPCPPVRIHVLSTLCDVISF